MAEDSRPDAMLEEMAAILRRWLGNAPNGIVVEIPDGDNLPLEVEVRRSSSVKLVDVLQELRAENASLRKQLGLEV